MGIYGPPPVSPSSRYGAKGLGIELHGFAELTELWSQAPDIVSEELLGSMTEADMLLLHEISDRTPKATGMLRGSEGSQEQVSDQGVLGVVSASINYAVPVELGTRPHFPPIQSLVDWVVAKGIASEKDARGIAYAIAHTIAKRGTIGTHMFERGLEQNRDQVIGMFEAGVARIVQRLSGYYGA